MAIRCDMCDNFLEKGEFPTKVTIYDKKGNIVRIDEVCFNCAVDIELGKRAKNGLKELKKEIKIELGTIDCD